MLASQGYRVEGIDIDCFNETDTHAHMGKEQKLAWKTMMERLPHVHFQHYYNSRIPFSDNTFDTVVAYGVIEHVPEAVLPDVMRDIRRVTKPGGHLMISYLPRQWALLELLLKLLGRPHHLRRWGEREICRFLNCFDYSVVTWKRVIYAPQFPAPYANHHKRLFDAVDRLAGIPPFSFLARDLSIIARKMKTG
jgi:SAM-dependent methyltransferase